MERREEEEEKRRLCPDEEEEEKSQCDEREGKWEKRGGEEGWQG